MKAIGYFVVGVGVSLTAWYTYVGVGGLIQGEWWALLYLAVAAMWVGITTFNLKTLRRGIESAERVEVLKQTTARNYMTIVQLEGEVPETWILADPETKETR